MSSRTLFDSLKSERSRTPRPQSRRGSRRRRPADRRLAIESLEDRYMLAAASLRLSDVALLEGNAGTHSAVAIVSLSAPKKHAVTVNYSTAHGDGDRRQRLQGRLRQADLRQGQTSKTIQVPVIGDRLVESDETFFVKLHDAKRAKIANGRGVVTIMDDEPRISISNVSPAGRELRHDAVHLHGQPVGCLRPAGDRQLRHHGRLGQRRQSTTRPPRGHSFSRRARRARRSRSWSTAIGCPGRTRPSSST